MSEAGIGTLLLTGAPGWFVDAWLQSAHVSAPHGLKHVRCFVHRATPLTASEAMARWGMDVEIVHGDLNDPESLERAVREVDTVVHAAAIIHVKHIRDYYAVNAEGTRRLALAAARAGARRFVFLSSNAAAGKAAGSDPLEETGPDRPLSHYGRSKLLAEKWLFEIAKEMEPVVLRPCMFYGPPVPPRHVDTYQRIIHGRMPLVGGGDYARSLVFIDNLVQCATLAMLKPAAAGQVYFVADRAPYTTRRVVEAMAEALGAKPRFLRLPAVVADVAYGVDELLATLGIYQQTVHLVGEANWNVGVSVEKARRDLGYEPAVEIEEGMRRAVAWCRERRLL